ncbi:MAG TPA: hypothetical protein VGM53_18835 [Streptosporangiaceae bacterium]|jgi:hypothetical protein
MIESPIRARLAAVAVAAAAVVAAGPVLPGSGPAAQARELAAHQQVAPRQFNPLAPFLKFGWLPAGYRLTAGDTTDAAMALVAQRSPRIFLEADAFAAGRCHFTAGGAKLKCLSPALEGYAEPVTGRAPAIGGHRAFWIGRVGCATCAKHADRLAWQYASNGWADVTIPNLHDQPGRQYTPAQIAAGKKSAVKVARKLQFAAAQPPLVFPVQLTRLPASWKVGAVFYHPGNGLLRASRFSLITGTHGLSADGGLVFQKNRPAFDDMGPALNRGNYCGTPPNKTINGYRVFVETVHNFQDLCAANADGLRLELGQRVQHPPISVVSLFAHHLRLLGANPAHWTTKPIG